MEFKTTYSNSTSVSGLTLVELMVATAIASIVFLALGSLSIYSATSFRSLVDYTDLNSNSRAALDQISREIRQSQGLISAPISNATMAVLNFKTEVGTSSLSYDKAARRVRLIRAGATKPVDLKDCTYFGWNFFTHTTIAGNFNCFTNNSDFTQCKVVELKWICGRDNYRKATNSQSIQSMKVVIRKKPD